MLDPILQLSEQVRKITNWCCKSIKINFKSHYYHLNLFIITIFATWRIFFQTICPRKNSTCCFKAMSGVWNLLPRWNGERVLNAGSAETQIFVQARPHFQEGAPNARQKNRLQQARSFTIASFRSARHFTLRFRYARGMSRSQPTNLAEDSRFGRWPAGISNRRSVLHSPLWSTFPKRKERMWESYSPTRSA